MIATSPDGRAGIFGTSGVGDPACDLLAHPPTPDRAAYLLSPIMFPIEEPEEGRPS